MKAITVRPGVANSVKLESVDEPLTDEGKILAETIAVGICGTDMEIVAGEYGQAVETNGRLTIGHESLARVVETDGASELRVGDLFVPIVRRPDAIPCRNCAVGEWDMCTNGKYLESGIKDRNGYASEFFRLDAPFAVKIPQSLGLLGVLVEPTSVVAKAWDHIEKIGARAHWFPRKVLVTGAGPVGLLAALMAVQKGFETHVLDKDTDGAKPALVKALGATYHSGTFADAAALADIVLECTGVAPLVTEVIDLAIPNCVKCLVGVSPGPKEVMVDVGTLTRSMVLDNEVIFGSVNANRAHYLTAVNVLANADPSWLEKLITRRVSLVDWEKAYRREKGDIKTVVLFSPLNLNATVQVTDFLKSFPTPRNIQ